MNKEVKGVMPSILTCDILENSNELLHHCFGRGGSVHDGYASSAVCYHCMCSYFRNLDIDCKGGPVQVTRNAKSSPQIICMSKSLVLTVTERH